MTFTVTVRRGGGRDTWGDDRPGATHTINGCDRWPRTGSSALVRTGTETVDRSDVVVSGWVLVVPPGSDIIATDEVRMHCDAGTVWWQVDGEPMAAGSPYGSPFSDSSWDPGVPVSLSRTEG